MADQLAHYLKEWGLSDPQPLAETVTSHVYTTLSGEERVVLKILTAVGMEERIGGAALRHFNGRGAVRLLRADEGVHLLEYAEGDDLVGMVKSGDDEQATGIIADVLNQLHAAPATIYPAELVPLQWWFRALFKGAEQDGTTGWTRFTCGARR